MSLSLVDDVQAQLDTDWVGRSMRGFETVGSTNTAAAEWAREGAPDGSTVVAEYQSDGRGRHGRTWAAQKGRNLVFSVVLRPALAPDRLGLITIAAGVAAAEAVDAFATGHRAALKWPNDVLLEGRKTCGMLLEASISRTQTAQAVAAEDSTVVVLGVGLNVNQTDFPDALADTATSLRLTTGRAVPRAPLLARLLRRLEARIDAVQSRQEAEAAPVRAAFQDRLVHLGDAITLRASDTSETIRGVVQGITETGALRLDTPDGPTVVHAGDVTSHV